MARYAVAFPIAGTLTIVVEAASKKAAQAAAEKAMDAGEEGQVEWAIYDNVHDAPDEGVEVKLLPKEPPR